MSSQAALFLDRDGVINVDHGHVGTPDRFEFIDGIFDLVRVARAHGLLVIVITNQAGIAKGKYTEEQFLATTQWMKERFAAESAPLTDVYYCPFHPEGSGKYRQVSTHRKPAPGMLLQAAREHDIALDRSLLIGDQETDIQAGRAAGVRATALYAPVTPPLSTAADIVVSSLAEGARWIAQLTSLEPASGIEQSIPSK